MEDISITAKKAAGWSGLSQFIKQIVDFGFGIVLARLLFPEDFGAVGITVIFSGFAMTFSQLGMAASIIQRKKIEERHLSTAFVTNVGVGCLICLALISISPLVGSFFKNEVVTKILPIISFIFIINAFAVVPYALLVRRLDFKKLALAEIGGAATFSVVATILAFLKWGVWSLVLGIMVSTVVSMILKNLVGKWRIKIGFDLQSFKELFSFGSKVTGNSILVYWANTVDNAIIGRQLGLAPLGIYMRAYNIITMPVTTIGLLIVRVLFPAFSRIQDDDTWIHSGYLKTVRLISLACFPILTGILLLAPEFIRVVYGPKWIPAVVPMQIMCFAGMLKCITELATPVILAKERVGVMVRRQGIYLAMLSLGLIIGCRWGVIGVAWVVAFASLLIFVMMQLLMNSIVKLNWKNFLFALRPAISGCLVMGTCVLIYRVIIKGILGENFVLILFSSVAVGIVSYIGFFYIAPFKTVRSLAQEVLAEPLKILSGWLKTNLYPKA